MKETTNMQLGPNLAKWLDLTPPQQTVAAHHLGDRIQQQLEVRPITDPALLVDLVDELNKLQQPLLALKLIEQHPIEGEEPFRLALGEGIAAMLSGDWLRAIEALNRAQQISPLEPAPYANIVQVYLAEDYTDEAKTWLEAGLKVEPNNFHFWELMQVCAQRRLYSEAEFAEVVERLNSWAGHLSLLSLRGTYEAEAVMPILSTYYESGERSPEFLLEYTGCLGELERFEDVLATVWLAEKIFGQTLSWKLRLHQLQAHAALGEATALQKNAQRLLIQKHVPHEAKVIVEELLKQNISIQ